MDKLWTHLTSTDVSSAKEMVKSERAISLQKGLRYECHKSSSAPFTSLKLKLSNSLKLYRCKVLETSALKTFHKSFRTAFRGRIILQRIVLKHDCTSQLVQLEGFHPLLFPIMIYKQVTMKTVAKYLLHCLFCSSSLVFSQ